MAVANHYVGMTPVFWGFGVFHPPETLINRGVIIIITRSIDRAYIYTIDDAHARQTFHYFHNHH